MDWVETQIGFRPKGPRGVEGINWRNIVFSDEFHLSLGPERTRRVKRSIGKVWKRKPWNVQKKKVNPKTARDMEKKEDHFKQLHIFIAIGYNYKKLVPYNAGNSNGKMSSKCYTEQILPALKDDLLREGLILCQDGDGSHTTQLVKTYTQDHGLEVLNLPHRSPDLSIFETLANPLKKEFQKERHITNRAAMSSFVRIFEELDQRMIQGLYNNYYDRLEECLERLGEMTHF